MAPRILIFSIAMGADIFFYKNVKSIATYAPTFLGHIVLVLAMVRFLLKCIAPSKRFFKININVLCTCTINMVLNDKWQKYVQIAKVRSFCQGLFSSCY